MSETGLLPQLTTFYKAQGIYSLDFKCPCLNEHCLRAAKGIGAFRPENFVEAKATFVGSKYEDRSAGCRLLFLSLDPGEADFREPSARTPEAVRHRTEGYKGPLPAKWAHWYWTHMLALQILKQFNPDLHQVGERLGGCKGVSTVAATLLFEVTPYFAHANAVKCSLGLPGNSQAPDEMYEVCSKYLTGELPLLCPDVIVTQGVKAAEALLNLASNVHPCSREIERSNVATISGHDVLWIRTSHPRNGNFFKEGGDCWKEFAKAVATFMNSKR